MHVVLLCILTRYDGQEDVVNANSYRMDKSLNRVRKSQNLAHQFISKKYSKLYEFASCNSNIEKSCSTSGVLFFLSVKSQHLTQVSPIPHR